MAEALQFVIEIGHKASTLKEPIGDFIYKWNLFLRSGDERQQIDKVVQKVVFNLHETFKNPTRECTQPPYCVKENGYGEFEFPIDIFFNGTNEKYTINYFLDLPPAQSLTPLYRFRKEVITFVDPNPDFRKLLIESGATVKKISSNCSATTSLKKKANSSSIINSSLNSPNTSVNSPNSSLVNLNSSKLNQAINGTSFLATHSVFPSEKKKSSSKKSLIRNDLTSQSPKPPSTQSTPIDTTSKAVANPTTPPKKQNLNRTTPDILIENKELLPKTNSAKTLVKHKSKLNAITNNDELDKLKNDLDFSNLSAGSKKRPFVQSNESIHTDSNKFDENKKKIQSDPELKFKKIKSSNKIMASCDTKAKAVENENKKAKSESENLLSTINSIITPPPSHSTNGTNSCTSSVSSSCNYNTSPTSLSSLCLNKEPNKLKTKSEFEEKIDQEELKKIRRRKNSANSDKDEDEFRKERDRDKHRRSSNHTHRRSHKRRNSNDYENDSDADSYYSYKNGHSRHHSKEAKPKSNRNGSVNGSARPKPDDDETSSTVSSMSNSSSSSGEKNYKKYSESKYSQNKQPTNHNREPRQPRNDADYIKRMLKLYDKIAFVHSTKQFDLLAKICGLVKPFSFTENSLFNFDLFTLDLSVVEKLEGLVMQSAQCHSIQSNSASTLDTSKKNKNNELVKT